MVRMFRPMLALTRALVILLAGLGAPRARPNPSRLGSGVIRLRNVVEFRFNV